MARIFCFQKRRITEKLSFVNERFAIGALTFGGVHFVSGNFNFVKRTIVAVLAVIFTVVDGAADIGICFSHKTKCLL